MGRSLVLAASILALTLLAVGCGGQPDFMKNAQQAKPTDIGTPESVEMGAKLLGGTNWLVKTEVNGEKRIFALVNKVPAGKRGQALGDLQFDIQTQQFHDKTRKYRYDIFGNALHTVPKGVNAGQPGISLLVRPIEKDPKTGHMMLYTYKTLPAADRDKADKGAYVVAP